MKMLKLFIQLSSVFLLTLIACVAFGSPSRSEYGGSFTGDGSAITNLSVGSFPSALTNSDSRAVSLASTLVATNGIASYSSIFVVAIAATGWTNIWSTNNAVVVFDVTTCFYTNYLLTGASYYTNVAALGHERMILQPGEGVAINGTGVTGIAKPF
jgi:hypothetical protein